MGEGDTDEKGRVGFPCTGGNNGRAPLYIHAS